MSSNGTGEGWRADRANERSNLADRVTSKGSTIAGVRGSPSDELLSSLFEREYRPLLRFAFLLSGGSDAEDLVQEAFARALVGWKRDAPLETFRPWVQKTLLRLHLNRLRRTGRELAAFARHGIDRADRADETQRLDVLNALQALTPRQRAAVVLRYYEDLPEAEVAERLGCRLGTAKALLNQARKRLALIDAIPTPRT